MDRQGFRVVKLCLGPGAPASSCDELQGSRPLGGGLEVAAEAVEDQGVGLQGAWATSGCAPKRALRMALDRIHVWG